MHSEEIATSEKNEKLGQKTRRAQTRGKDKTQTNLHQLNAPVGLCIKEKMNVTNMKRKVAQKKQQVALVKGHKVVIRECQTDE